MHEANTDRDCYSSLVRSTCLAWLGGGQGPAWAPPPRPISRAGMMIAVQEHLCLVHRGAGDEKACSIYTPFTACLPACLPACYYHYLIIWKTE